MLRLLLLVIFLVVAYGCSSTGEKLSGGKEPAPMNVEFHYYDGEPKPLTQVAMLSTEHTTGEAKLYFISVDGRKDPNKRGIIGGPLRAFVLPGVHEVKIQFHDKGKILMPVTLPDVKVEAGRVYHFDSQATYPEKGTDFAAMLSARVRLTVTDAQSNEVVFDRTVNGMGREAK